VAQSRVKLKNGRPVCVNYRASSIYGAAWNAIAPSRHRSLERSRAHRKNGLENIEIPFNRGITRRCAEQLSPRCFINRPASGKSRGGSAVLNSRGTPVT